MASNWQYATLSAGERLSRIRDGEYEIYTQEIARANEVIKNRKELGLDISEQLAWIKKLDYVRTNNNGLGGALTAEEIDYNTKMGKTFTTTTQSNNAIANLQSVANFQSANINNANSINNSGSINSGNIGSIIGNNANSNSGAINNTITNASNIPSAPQLPAYTPSYSSYNFEQELQDFMQSQKKRRDELETTLQKELQEKYGLLDTYYGRLNTAVQDDTLNKKSDYYANAVSRLPAMYEKFANSGLSFDGGKVRSEQMSYNNALNKSLAALDAQAIGAVNSNNLSKATERSKAYSDYTSRLSQENTRLDDMEYQMMRDLQDNSYKQNQFAWEQYKYTTQYEFDKYKYEQQLRETAEQKTLEQQRWEKEFELKLSAQEFDQLLRTKQLTLETDKYIFDMDKYAQEYTLKQQDYDLKLQQYYSDLEAKQQDYALKLQQYYSDLEFKQQDYDLRAQEFNLKVDLAEFNKMLDNLQYTFDVEKFEKEYVLKQSAQNFDAEKFSFDVEKFYKEYELKQQQYTSDYDYKVQQSQTQNAQWEREMALKEAIQKSNLTQAEKDYALKYLDLEKKYSQTSSTSTSSSSNTSSSVSSSSTQTNSANTNSSSTSTSSTTTLYQSALTTAMWMKTQYVSNGKNTTRKFSDNDIDNWINTLQLSAADKSKLKRAIGI